MHSRIFQVSFEKEAPNTYIDDEEIFHNVPCDYCTEITYKEGIANGLNWLESVLIASSSCKREGNKFTVLHKEKYFANAYSVFMEEIQKLCKEMDLNTFSSTEADNVTFKLRNEYEDKYGFWMVHYNEKYGYYSFYSLDAFMRSLKDGDVFYIHKVFDYHF